jgi:hypothetical protein
MELLDTGKCVSNWYAGGSTSLMSLMKLIFPDGHDDPHWAGNGVRVALEIIWDQEKPKNGVNLSKCRKGSSLGSWLSLSLSLTLLRSLSCTFVMSIS